MRYVYFLLLMAGCVSQSQPEKVPQADIPAAFASNSGTNAASFQLNNRDSLFLPAGGNGYHQQGIQYLDGGGWVVSGSGKDQGYLYFTNEDGSIHTVLTVPDDLDIGDSLKYNHPGGFQITNHILAIGLEHKEAGRQSYSRIVLLDVSDPKAPQHLSHLDIIRKVANDAIMTAGAVAIAELTDCYLIIVGNWDSKRLDFYQTSSKDLKDKNTTVSACLGSWETGVIGKSYQNINVYGNSLDELYLIGLYSKNRTHDVADLFALDVSDWDSIQVIKKAEQPFSGGEAAPHFVHGGGTHYDPVEARLWVYAVEAHSHEHGVWCNIWGR